MEIAAFLFIGVLILFGIVSSLSISSARAKNQRIEDEIRQVPSFNPSVVTVKQGAFAQVPFGVAIDNEARQMCLIAGEARLFKPFEDIIECEVLAAGRIVLSKRLACSIPFAQWA